MLRVHHNPAVHFLDDLGQLPLHERHGVLRQLPQFDRVGEGVEEDRSLSPHRLGSRRIPGKPELERVEDTADVRRILERGQRQRGFGHPAKRVRDVHRGLVLIPGLDDEGPATQSTPQDVVGQAPRPITQEFSRDEGHGLVQTVAGVRSSVRPLHGHVRPREVVPDAGLFGRCHGVWQPDFRVERLALLSSPEKLRAEVVGERLRPEGLGERRDIADLPSHVVGRRLVRPHADNDSTISSTPVRRRCRFLTICGSKLPAVSRGTFTSTGPTSVSTVLARVPLRLLPLFFPAGSCFS